MTKLNMTYGLYLGIGYIFVIMLFHLMGYIHYPGDQSGWINAGLLGFAMVYSARKVQEVDDINPMPYRLIFRIGIQISFFSSLILAFFIYCYFGFIADGGIAHFISVMEIAFAESGAFSPSQQELMLELYRTNLNAGYMAFTSGFSQFILGFFISLIAPFMFNLAQRFNLRNQKQ